MDAATGDHRDPQLTAGALNALLAYGAWGLMPVYWKLVSAVPAPQMVAHRVVWSVVVLAVLLGAFRRWRVFARCLASPRQLLLLLLTATLIAGNWLIFIWAVQAGFVLNVSLGYFINPLVNVALGVIVLGERLRPRQGLAVLIAAAGVVYLGWQLGVVPWISLGLALSFAIYGLLRKLAPVDALVGLSVETLLLGPVAAAYLLWCAGTGRGAFPSGQWSLDALVVAAGLATALPLLWFANAARRLRYATLGFFQYLAPSVQLLLAVAVYGEAFTTVHAVTFGCIWAALLLYSADAVAVLRRRPARR